MSTETLIQFLMGLMSLGIAAAVGLLWSLNTKLVVVIYKVTNHEDRLKRLETKKGVKNASRD